jgi:hypothetical protein
VNNDYKLTLLIFVVFFFFSVLFIKALAPHGLATSPDSLSYMEMANNIQNGNGAVGLNRSFTSFPKKELVPITIWPPLYPVVIAKLLPVSPNETNISYVSSLFLSICLLIMFLLISRMTTRLNAIGLSLLFCMTVPILLDYSYVWSETLFLTLYTCVLWAIVNFLEYDIIDSRKKYIFLFLISIFIVALFYTRYAGVSITLLLFYVFFKSKNPVKEIPCFTVAGLIISIPIIYLMYSNYLISNSMSGDLRTTSNISPLENIQHLFSSFSVLFPSTIDAWLLCAVITTVFAMQIHHVLKKKTINMNQYSSSLILQPSFVLFVYYIVAIVVLRSVKEFDSIGVRLVSPAFPPFWIFCCVILFHRFMVRWQGLVCIFLILFVMLSIVYQGGVLYHNIRNSLATYDSPVYPYRRNFTHTNITMTKVKGETKHIFTTHCSDVKILFSQRPMQAEFVTDIPGVTMPDSLDQEFIEELNRLSIKACFLFDSQPQLKAFSEVVSKRGDTFKFINLDSSVLVQYPLNIYN